MAVDQNELYADLCNQMDIAEQESPGFAAAADGVVVSPILVNLIRVWVISQAKKLACDNREVILATVQQWVDRFIQNDQVALVLMNVAETVIVTLCGSAS